MTRSQLNTALDLIIKRVAEDVYTPGTVPQPGSEDYQSIKNSLRLGLLEALPHCPTATLQQLVNAIEDKA